MPLQFINNINKAKDKSSKTIVNCKSSEFIPKSKYTTTLKIFETKYNIKTKKRFDSIKNIVNIIDSDIEKLAIQQEKEFWSELMFRIINSNSEKLQFKEKSKFKLDKELDSVSIPNIETKDLDLIRQRILNYLGLKYYSCKKSIGKKQYIFIRIKDNIKVVYTKDEISQLLIKSKFSFFR